MSSNQPEFMVDALYCHEQVDNYYNTPSGSPSLQQHDDDQELTSLLHKEQEWQLHLQGADHPSTLEAVHWMLKVVHYYSFSALTALLAVNYLHRFLHTFKSDGEKPWMTQLAAVACISLAAKVEETHVPLLLDLQVEDSNYVFESKTIQRMEILVLSTLEWKMNPVTPLSFLDCIAKKLGFFTHISSEFLRRCHCLLLSLLSDCRFMRYPASALATATMLYVISGVEPTIGVQHRDQLIGILGISKDKVESCCRLIEEVSTGTGAGLFYSCNKRKLPGSPKGVVDVCFSSDDSSAASSPEHFAKKFKSK
ncbi:cyclin-D3-1-like [Salvia miltiorrhiza]|uniref:cyclin-D3-1-like n=1 Tax=Salvia miltiorrhiza TaxID=226208 RepID=UPI0025AC9869|nr:cyclin-D3-1-like [Salvia miltiorrhiza]